MNQAPAITISSERLEQIHALIAQTSFSGGQLVPLAGDASFRRYIRIHKDGQSAMIMDAPPVKENVRPFITAAQYLYEKGYSAPALLAQNIPAGLLLLEDLGNDSFTRLLQQADDSKRVQLEHELYGAAIDILVQWHDPKLGFSNDEELLLPRYDTALLMRETELFSEWFLPQIMDKDDAEALFTEYHQLWQSILSDAPLAMNCWVHRDYHADNLMWLPKRDGVKRVGLLDFQDGVYGDSAYDMVSLLEDARRDVSHELANAMIERYIAQSGVSPDAFHAAYAILGAQRNSKIIGIFTRLAARDNKEHYLDYLPRVWSYLEHDLQHPSLSKLKEWLDQHVDKAYRGVIAVKRNVPHIKQA